MNPIDKSGLIERIREHFPDTPWPANKQAHIGPEGDLDCDYVRDHFQGKRWSEISAEELGNMYLDCWAFTDEALRYFLPAWILKSLNEGVPHLGCVGSYLDTQWEAVCLTSTAGQKEIILEVLLHSFPSRGWPSPDHLIAALLREKGLEDQRPDEEW